jgi:sulfate adenylyltransferase subunit 1
MAEFSNKAYLDMELLRFTTAGSVDDGKSTLIGRLLYDSKSIFEDQLEAVKKASIQKGSEYLNLALFTDGLRSEREQGITIDVAYRYFNTPRRKFIIADTPGHVQYTRNMVTGASTANAAIVLIDARNGVIEQTRRHSFIASLLGIPSLIVCINKMDLVDFQESRFNEIRADFDFFAKDLNFTDTRFVPISALLGDNVVEPSANMHWYHQGTLLQILESIPLGNDLNFTDARFPVQYVVRPLSNQYHDYRGYAGRIDGGIFKKGDKIIVLPAGHTSNVKSIDVYEGSVEQAFPPMSVTIQLEDDIDISRGDMIVKEDSLPQVDNEFEAMVCWMNPTPLKIGGFYALKHTTRDVRAVIKDIVYKVEITTLDQNCEDKSLKMNEIARLRIKTTKPLVFDPYKRNRKTGSLILIDEATNETVGVGMIQ